jgi:hypothetical protein
MSREAKWFLVALAIYVFFWIAYYVVATYPVSASALCEAYLPTSLTTECPAGSECPLFSSVRMPCNSLVGLQAVVYFIGFSPFFIFAYAGVLKWKHL